MLHANWALYTSALIRWAYGFDPYASEVSVSCSSTEFSQPQQQNCLNYNVRLGAFVRLRDDLIGSNVGAALARDNPAICPVQYTTAARARPDETAGRSDGRSAERRGKGSGASCREKKGDVGFLASQPASWLLPRSRCGAAVYLSVCLSPSILFMLYRMKWVESPYFSFICF